MDKHAKLYEHILMRRSDANVSFAALGSPLERLGFVRRIRGDHHIFHIFTKAGVDEILNLQPRGGEAKPYQVKQVRGVILRYGLSLGDVNHE
jgi:hypothetical protein